MTEQDLNKLGSTLWAIANELRGTMDADDFRDYMLSFLFLCYLSGNYEASAKKELGRDYPTLEDDDKRAPLAVWYEKNQKDIPAFEKQMRRKVHYVIEPQHLWNSIAALASDQHGDLLKTLQQGFKYRGNESFENNFQGLFSEINLDSDKLGKNYSALNLLSHGSYAIHEPALMGEDNQNLFRDILKGFIDRFQFDLPEIFSETRA